MKLGIIIANREILQLLYKTRLDGRRALKLRKYIKALNEEILTFEEARNDYIREHGSGEPPKIQPGTNGYTEFIKYLNEMAESEVESPDPILTESDLEHFGELSIEDIDRIEALGLLEIDRVKKQPQK